MVALAVYVAIRLDTATGRSFETLFSDERLSYPAGYPNATAAQWLMAFWPALLLARGARLPWAVRGLFAGGAVVLADVALLSQSRGSLYAMAVMVALVFALRARPLAHFRHGRPGGLGRWSDCAARAARRRTLGVSGAPPTPLPTSRSRRCSWPSLLVGLTVSLVRPSRAGARSRPLSPAGCAAGWQRPPSPRSC